MKKVFWLVLICLSGIFVLLVGRIFFVPSGCEDVIKKEVSSPNGKYIATVFERDCGATTDFSTIVSLREAGQKFNPKRQGLIVTTKGQNEIALNWRTDELLVIKLPLISVFVQEKHWKHIAIAYE